MACSKGHLPSKQACGNDKRACVYTKYLFMSVGLLHFLLQYSKLAQTYHIFFSLQPGTVIAIIGSYGLFLLCCMGWFAKKIPMRIYYDEANDKTVAVFMHLLIPFRFSKKSLPHHSFRIIKTNAKDGYSISNGQLKLMLTPGMFRKPADFTRLLSQ